MNNRLGPGERALVVTGASTGIGRATGQEDDNELRGDQGSALVVIGQNVLQGLRGRGERGGA